MHLLRCISRVLDRRRSSPRQDGIAVIVEKEDAEIDIVAIHGLGAHPEFTWTTKIPTDLQQAQRPESNAAGASKARRKSIRNRLKDLLRPKGQKEKKDTHRLHWLQDDEFLRKDFKTARIMTFGYNSDWFLQAPMTTAKQRAQTLLEELADKRKNINHLRPILLIGHSFGGIVIEHAINEAEKEYKNIFEAICGIIFLGTPFQGSDFATPARLLVHISAPFGSKTILLRLLQSHSQELANLREDFIRSISRMKPFRSRETVWEVDESPFIYTFFEDIDTVLLGLISVGKIVNRDSASLDIAKRRIPIDKDHSGLNKCHSRSERLYIELCRAIEQVLIESRRGPYMKSMKTKETMSRLQEGNITEIRGRITSNDNQAAKEKWYRNTREYKEWKGAETSEFIWFRGRTDTGKTLEAANVLHFYDETKGNEVDAIAYFCRRSSERTETILHSIIIQLGRSGESRVESLDDEQKRNLLLLAECSSSIGTELLWGIFQSLLRSYSGRNVCMILDGVDALHSEDLEGFAARLYRIWRSARDAIKSESTKTFWIKLLITSRPHVELAEIFRNESVIDPDTDMLECLRSLSKNAENPRQNDQNINKTAYRTCEWILSDPRYQNWISYDQSRVLWLIGKPGSGKSTLLRKLLKETLRPTSIPSLQNILTNMRDMDGLDRTETRQKLGHDLGRCEDPDTLYERKVVASYFYNFRNKNEVENKRMMQSVIFQILTQEPRLFPVFKETNVETRVLREGNFKLWTFDDIIAIFRAILNFKGFRLRIELFIDAIDESANSSGVMDILLREVNGQRRSDVTVKAIVARRQMDAVYEISPDQQIRLESHNEEDIDRLINQGVESIEKVLGSFDDRVDFIRNQCHNLQEGLKSRAKGVILWVSLALTTILEISRRGSLSVDAMMKTLDGLPSDLESLYAHIIGQLQNQSREDVEKTKLKLRWSAHTSRTLTVNEFFHAVALSESLLITGLSCQKLEYFVIPHSRIDGVRTTLSSTCGGLLEAQAPEPGILPVDAENFLVQIIHRTVRNFLEKEEAGPFRTVKQECICQISKACLHYLRITLVDHGKMENIDFVKHVGRHSLLAYILTELPLHLSELGQDDLAKRIQDLSSLAQKLAVLGSTHPGRLTLHTWILQLLPRISSTHRDIEKQKSTILTILRESQLPSVTFRRFFQSALVSAIRINNVTAFRIIWDAGAPSCDDEYSILSMVIAKATNMHNITVLEIVEDRWKCVSSMESTKLQKALGNALVDACKSGSEAISKWLLERIALSGMGDQGLQAIREAVDAGHDSIVQILLKYGIASDSKTKDSRTLLSMAAEKGHIKVVELLLNAGADPEVADRWGRTPLSLAAVAGHEAVVKFLISSTEEELDRTEYIEKRILLVPHHRDPSFMGREEVLQSLEDALTSGAQCLSLVGLGGVGKTATAVEFAYRIFERGEDVVSTVLWMDASSDYEFVQDHDYVNQRIHWQLPISRAKELLTAFYHQLSLEPNTKLVIWDNADDDSEMIQLALSLPKKNVCILMTSRNKGFARTITRDGQLIDLEGFSPSEAVAYLEHNLPAHTYKGNLRAIAERLSCLPLALEQATRSMRSARMSPARYLRLLGQDAGNSIYEISSVIDHTLEQLERGAPSALELLSFMCVLDAHSIPKYLLLHQSSGLVTEDSTANLAALLAELERYSLISISTRGHISLHRLVQDATHRRLFRSGQRVAWENEALKAISHEFPEGTFENWGKCSELLPHALVVRKYDVTEDKENFDLIFNILLNAGLYTMNIGKYEVSKSLLEKAYTSSLRVYGTESKQCQSVAEALAPLFVRQGKLNQAEKLILETLNVSQRLFITRDPGTLASINNLAVIYMIQGRLKKAKKLNLRALKGREKIYGLEDPDTLASVDNLASIYRKEGQWKKAEELSIRVIESRKKVLGPEHPDSLTSIDNLASIYWKEGRWQKAETLNRQILESRTKVLGPEHPDTLTSIANLAYTLKDQGRGTEARALIRTCVQLRRRILGANHPDSMSSSQALARWETAADGAARDMADANRG